MRVPGGMRCPAAHRRNLTLLLTIHTCEAALRRSVLWHVIVLTRKRCPAPLPYGHRIHGNAQLTVLLLCGIWCNMRIWSSVWLFMEQRKTHSPYFFTGHALNKMRYYKLSQSRVIRVIRNPTRVEEAILEGAVGVMQPAGTKDDSEIWVMYLPKEYQGKKELRIITAWRYPTKSPERDPIPEEVLKEVRNIIWSTI